MILATSSSSAIGRVSYTLGCLRSGRCTTNRKTISMYGLRPDAAMASRRTAKDGARSFFTAAASTPDFPGADGLRPRTTCCSSVLQHHLLQV